MRFVSRAVRALAYIESLVALGGYIVSAGLATWIVTQDIVWIVILCSAPAILGTIPLALRIQRALRARRPETVSLSMRARAGVPRATMNMTATPPPWWRRILNYTAPVVAAHPQLHRPRGGGASSTA